MWSAMVSGMRSKMVSSLSRTEGKDTAPAAKSVSRTDSMPRVFS